jgi:formylglycine-generating enzyme required for sulfatase activity
MVIFLSLAWYGDFVRQLANGRHWLDGTNQMTRLTSCFKGASHAILALATGLVVNTVAIRAADPPAAPKLLVVPFEKDAAKKAQEAWAKYLGKKVEEQIDLGDGIKMTMVLIPPGIFQIGSPKDELNLQEGVDQADEFEMPQHRVTISKPFYLGKYAVTQGQYTAVTGKENPSCFCQSGKGKQRVAGIDTARYPVETVSWLDAEAFCSALQKKLGMGWEKARLPSEAMREYACRAGTKTRWFVGNQMTAKDAYFGEHRIGSLNRTREVGFGASNAFGLFDMHGNVWEWCSDWSVVYSNENQTDPEGPESGQFRAFRGGAWSIPAGGCRSAYRGRSEPSFHNNDLGFRVAVIPTLP